MCARQHNLAGNRKVSGFNVVSLQLSKKLCSHCSSLPSCLNNDLVSTGEAPWPAVTSLGTIHGINWRNKRQLSHVSHSR